MTDSNLFETDPDFSSGQASDASQHPDGLVDEGESPDDLSLMRQSTLDLLAILDAHRDIDAQDVMGGLLRLTEELDRADEKIRAQMRSGQSPDLIFEAMVAPMPLALRFGARDLDAVTRRATTTFSDILGDEGPLPPEAAADTLVWLSICAQTRIAARLLFQVAHLYGRAPNGQKLPTQ